MTVSDLLDASPVVLMGLVMAPGGGHETPPPGRERGMPRRLPAASAREGCSPPSGRAEAHEPSRRRLEARLMDRL